MIAGRELLLQAVNELARSKPRSADPTYRLTRLYTAALADWADRLAVSPLDLNRLVLMRVAVPEPLWHQTLQAIYGDGRSTFKENNGAQRMNSTRRR